MNLNLHDIKDVVITENSTGNHSQSRDIVFMDHEGKVVFSIDVFSNDQENGINIKLVGNESFYDWQFKESIEE